MKCQCSCCYSIIITDDLKELEDSLKIGCVENESNIEQRCSDYGGSCRFSFNDDDCQKYQKENGTDFIIVGDL